MPHILRVVGAVLALLPACLAAADWVAHVDGLGGVGGVAERGDEVVVFGSGRLVFISPQLTTRRAVEYEFKSGDAHLQPERMVAAGDGFLITGVLANGVSLRPTLIRVDGDGAIQWARVIDADGADHRSYAAELQGGDIVFAVRHGDASAVLRLSPAGEIVWARELDRTDIDEVMGVIATRDGGMLLASRTRGRFGALTRLAPNGDVMWDRVLGTADAGAGLYSAVEMPDGDFVAVGRMREYATNDRDAWLVRVSREGEVRWQKRIGGDGEDGLYSITATRPDELVMVGGTKSGGRGDADLWVVHATADGTITQEIAIGTELDEGPHDGGYTDVAAAQDGRVIMGGPGHLHLMVGNVRAMPAGCAQMRRISSQVRDPRAVHMPGAFTAGPVELHATALKVEAVTYPVTTSAACRWTGGEFGGRVAPPAAAMQEETIFADRVARLLLDRRFADLDALAAELRTSGETFDSGAWKLRAFYEALAVHATLTSLGAEEHAARLEAWRQATDSGTSRVAVAAYLNAAAARVRGSGFVSTIVREDAETYSTLIACASERLDEAEQRGECDPACYDLRIRLHALGGWSEPLRKLLQIAPTYWEAFPAAIHYLHPNWGGRPGDIQEFVRSAAEATKGEVGDAVYARFMQRESYRRDIGPPEDWPRIRKGFMDFQKLHPRSRQNAFDFAQSAYWYARDRKTLRDLFETPLLQWPPPPGTTWTDRADYERARKWAFAPVVEPFGDQLDGSVIRAVPREWPQVVARLRIDRPGGASETMHAFVVATSAGDRVGVTMTSATVSAPRADSGPTVRSAAPPAPVPATLVVADKPLSMALTPVDHDSPWARFVPPAAALDVLHPLKPAEFQVRDGDRLFVVACANSADPCAPRIVPAVVDGAVTSGPCGCSLVSPLVEDWSLLVGAPVLDQLGAVAGMVQPLSGDVRSASVVAIPYLVRELGEPK